MTNEKTQQYYSKLQEILQFHIQNELLRASMLAFIEVNKSRLVLAPASGAVSKHHAEPGGLLQHIVEVATLGVTYLQDMISFEPQINNKQLFEDLAVSSALHDIHKIGDPFGRTYYEPNMIKASRKKDETMLKQSEAKPYVHTDTTYHCGPYLRGYDLTVFAVAELLDRNLKRIPEGELSLFFVQATTPGLFTLLNDSVRFSIRYHDGAYGTSMYELAGKETPVMLALHFADMVSSRRSRWVSAGAEVADE